MDLENLMKKPLFWIVVVFTLLNASVFIMSKFIVDRAADRVIEKLEKEYSPSPYGPGLDPDLVNVNAASKERLYFELTQAREHGGTASIQQPDALDQWNTEWEADRGFPGH